MTKPDGHGGRWRLLVWGGALGLWLLPAVAMLLTSEVQWDLGDFVVWAAMLAAAAGNFELGMLLSRDVFYRAGFAVAIGAGFLLVWSNLAVGIIGREEHPANLLFFGVIALGAAIALLVRFRPRGMAWALVAAAVAHAGVAAWAYLGGLETRPQVLLINAFFVGCWLLSATLFQFAAGARPPGVAAGEAEGGTIPGRG